MGIEPPVRLNLAMRTASILRDALLAGEWEEFLPSEERLCASLHVSRPTLRVALKKLTDDGLIQTNQGRRRRILSSPSTPPVFHLPQKVGVVSSCSLDAISKHSLILYHEAYHYLRTLGCEVEFHADKRLEASNPSSVLELMVAENPSRLWLLLSASAPVQRWFAGQSLQAVVVGHCHSGICLAALDMNHAAISQHAAAGFKAKRHRHIVFIRSGRGEPYAGDLVSEQVFLRAFREDRAWEGTVRTLHTDASRAGHDRVVRQFLKLMPRPTAAFFCKSDDAIAFASRLPQQGLHIPDDISLVCRDSENALEAFHPDITRYGKNATTEARKLTSLLRQFFSRDSLRSKQYFIMPDFHRGATLAFPKSQDSKE